MPPLSPQKVKAGGRSQTTTKDLSERLGSKLSKLLGYVVILLPIIAVACKGWACEWSMPLDLFVQHASSQILTCELGLHEHGSGRMQGAKASSWMDECLQQDACPMDHAQTYWSIIQRHHHGTILWWGRDPTWRIGWCYRWWMWMWWFQVLIDVNSGEEMYYKYNRFNQIQMRYLDNMDGNWNRWVGLARNKTPTLAPENKVLTSRGHGI